MATEKFVPCADIFKAYDIRGIVDQSLTEDAVRLIGQALASEARAQAQQCIVIGRDGRLSGERLAAVLAEGICAAGVDVVDIGCVPTPVTYFAAYALGYGSCVSLTGSHNPPDYNGLKIVINERTLFGEHIQALRERIVRGDLMNGQGRYSQRFDVLDLYRARVVEDVRLSRPMKIAIDCGNGVAGVIAPTLLEAMGCEVQGLFCEVDGHFPNHHPDPSKTENLADLITAVASGEAELGLAFDGDGDRLGVVTKDGEIIYPDRQIMLFAEDILRRVAGGKIVYDVKCTRNLAHWVRRHGGEPLMWNTGHALIKAKLRESGAPFAGEMSGHLFFVERWYGFDDALYAAARLLEILSRSADPSAVLKTLPDALCTPELNLSMQEGEPFELVRRLQANPALFGDVREVITIDGVRVEYEDGFGLVRASNTTPVVVLRFEADDAAALSRIQQAFRHALQASWPDLNLPF